MQCEARIEVTVATAVAVAVVATVACSIVSHEEFAEHEFCASVSGNLIYRASCRSCWTTLCGAAVNGDDLDVTVNCPLRRHTASQRLER